MFIFSKAFPLLKKGYRIKHKTWPDLYFISYHNNEVHDSFGNLYAYDFETYFSQQAETADAAGHVWEIYYEITDENL
jgi:hypothetical protein